MAGIFSKYTDDIPLIEFKIGNTLFSIQHIRCNIIENIPAHVHPEGCYEIHLIKSGYGKFIVEGKTHSFAPGTLIFIGPNVLHQKIVTDEMNTVAEWVNIYAKKVTDTKKHGDEELVPLDELFLSTGFWTGNASDSIAHMFDLAVRELILKDPEYQNVVEACMKGLIVSVTRNFHSERPLKKDASSIIGIKYPVIMDDYFMMNYSTLSLTELSHRLNLSERQTQRLIHEYYGMSFQQRKLTAKMRAAKMLIEEDEDLNMSEIAIKLGYPSLEYFSTTFRKYYGLSPREYRKKLKAKSLK